MTEGEKPSFEIRDQGEEIDVTELLYSSASDGEFAEKIAQYGDSDKLVLNIRIADMHPTSIKRFVTGRGKALVRIHCTLDEFNEYGNSENYPKGAGVDWVVE